MLPARPQGEQVTRQESVFICTTIAEIARETRRFLAHALHHALALIGDSWVRLRALGSRVLTLAAPAFLTGE